MSTVPQSFVLTVADYRDLDEAEMFESPLFPGLTISAAEIFKP
jgi:hypothetical protein